MTVSSPSPIGFPAQTTGKIGYVVKRYPRFSETFVVNEILAHEAEGREIEIFALRPVEETHFQNIISKVRAPVTRLRQPLRKQDSLWEAQKTLYALRPTAMTAMMQFPESSESDLYQAILLALDCLSRNITHLHAHFGTLAATVARIAAALAGITWSVTLHAKDIYCDYDEDHHLPLKLADADAVVTVSDYNVRYLNESLGCDPQKLVRIFNGIDLNAFSWSAPQDQPHEILAVGRLVEKKGFHILVEALHILRDKGLRLPCRIVGGGDMQQELQDQIDASGLSETVHLIGPMPQDDIIRAMQKATLLACPCIVGADGNRDGMPTVLLEAMALGCPVVATPVTGIPELVTQAETGLLAQEGNPRDLADQLARLWRDAELRAALSRNARARIEADFNLHKNAAELGRIFDRLRCDDRAVAAQGGL
ncbi:glycosyltransferase family 4 protein [Celeribacter ethanolicus]|uniref:glycosyltransferase family 4 protein n=1 Tax=Celeribacter ethanolicus TaxID=1758178 RepID=UPI00082D3610|nr:glycosyltransferase family 4 protein [Celeribacter ethanolicus]